MATPKKTFILRLEETTYRQLARWAEDEFRSMNGQIEMLLTRAIKDAKRDKTTYPKSFKEVKK